MKRDHTYLLTWISTEVIVTLLFVFAGSGPLSVLTRLNGRNVVMENWIFYLVGTLLLCLVLGIVMYRTGIRMNGKSKIESMAPPVLDQIIAAGIYLVISAVFRFSYLVNPFACYLAIVFWSGGQVDYSPRAENIFHLLSLAIFYRLSFWELCLWEHMRWQNISRITKIRFSKRSGKKIKNSSQQKKRIPSASP